LSSELKGLALVFATNNTHKLQEIQVLLPKSIKLKTLDEIGCFEDIPETSDTIEGNASQKAWFVYDKYNLDCFADDTGLEVEVLNNEPGVLSARYAGDQKNSTDNIKKLLSKLEHESNRKARFKTIISLILKGKEYIFEGIVEGEILKEPTGEKGFGYDPVLKPNGYDLSFAQMTLEEKNKISHRALAVKKLVDFLSRL